MKEAKEDLAKQEFALKQKKVAQEARSEIASLNKTVNKMVVSSMKELEDLSDFEAVASLLAFGHLNKKMLETKGFK